MMERTELYTEKIVSKISELTLPGSTRSSLSSSSGSSSCSQAASNQNQDTLESTTRNHSEELQLVSCIDDLQNLASAKLDKQTFEYYSSGADAQITLAWNRDILQKRYYLCPKILCNVEHVDLTKYVFGDRLSMPIGVSPTAMHKMAHPDGETATVRACNRINTLMILSLFSNAPLEEVAKQAPVCVKWQNIILFRDRDLLQSFIDRSTRYGYRALVVTCDAPVPGHRRSAITNNFKIKYPLGNLNDDRNMSVAEHGKAIYNPTATWQDLAELKKSVGDTIRVIVKGIMTPEDAEAAVAAGVDAVYVSNHGGRQLDGLPSTIEVLPSIVKAVNKRCPVFVDGGFRTGGDILKGLALGADMVFVGRPIVYGLMTAGEEGVYRALKILQEELVRAMALCGCSRLEDIKPNLVVDRDMKLRQLRREP